MKSFASFDQNTRIISIVDLNAQSTQTGLHEISVTLDDGTDQIDEKIAVIIVVEEYKTVAEEQ